MFTRGMLSLKQADGVLSRLGRLLPVAAGVVVMVGSSPAKALDFTFSFIDIDGVGGQVSGVITGLNEGAIL